VITIRGELTKPAEARTNTRGEAVLMLYLDNLPWPIEVARTRSAEPADHAAVQTVAQKLRRGDTVWVTARGIAPRTDHAHAVLAVRDVERVQLGSVTV